MPKPLTSVYIGIDVACGKNKRLPSCCVEHTDRLMPLHIPDELAALIPEGPGNVEIKADHPFRSTAEGVGQALRIIAKTLGWRIERIAIDAPAIAPATSPRACEAAMGSDSLSSFRTPVIERWPDIIARCRDHLERGGPASRLPFANMIWMLYGFELYKSLRETFDIDVIETYPAGIIHAIARGCEHKSTPEGYRRQLEAAASRTGWKDPGALERRLKETVALTRHDRLDAFMAAWIASLLAANRRAYGDPENPDDSIWVPDV